MAKKTVPPAAPAAPSSPPVTTEAGREAFADAVAGKAEALAAELGAPMEPAAPAAEPPPAAEGGPQGDEPPAPATEAAPEAPAAPTAAQAPESVPMVPRAEYDELLGDYRELAAMHSATSAPTPPPLPFEPTVLRVRGRPTNGNAVELRRDDGTERWGLHRQVRGGHWQHLVLREERSPMWVPEFDPRITLLPLAEAAGLVRHAE